MTTYYVRPTVGNDTNGGTSWASDSWATLKKAADTVSANDIVVMDNANADVLTVDTVYSFADGVRIISSANGTSYTAGAAITTTTTGVDVNIEGTCALRGITITLGDSTDVNQLRLAQTASDQQEFYECTLGFAGNNTGSTLSCGATASPLNTCLFVKCNFTWASTGQGINVNNCSEFLDCDLSSGATHPAVIFKTIANGAGITCSACDLSDIDTIFESAPASPLFGVLSQCKLKAGATIFAPTSHAFGNAYVYDSNSGDTHITIAHYNYYGSTTISGSVYASDNIADSNLSWVVAGSAAASKATPYRSPWLPVYHTGTSAITPYLEVLRSGSTTSYLESEAWINVLAKTTSGSTKSTLYTNRANPLDTTTDNTDSSKGAGDWVGEDASNNWYGKLILNGSITPAEAGHISAQVCLAGEYTLYVDPQIRGLS